MRNITKFKRSIRAISPVISALLMIAIAVIAGLVAYAWVMGYMGNQTGKADNSIQLQSFTTQGNLVVYVQNTGQGTVHLKYDGAVYVNDVLKNILLVDDQPAIPLDPIPITEGQTLKLVIDYIPLPNEELHIKIVTIEGTFIEGSGDAGQQSATNATITFQMVDAGSSSITPSVGAHSYFKGSVIPITAIAGSEYYFQYWSSNPTTNTIYGTSDSTTYVKVNVDGTVTATFATTPPSPTPTPTPTTTPTDNPNPTDNPTPTATPTETPPTNTPTPTDEPTNNNKLAFVAGTPQSLQTGTASEKITIQRQDSTGTPITTGTTTVTLSATAGTFYSDSACTNAITTITINSNLNGADFYYKSSIFGTQTLTAQATDYQTATTTFTITPANPTSYTVTYTVNNPAYGTINPSGTINYGYGDKVTITATPKTGYVFTSWTHSGDINIVDTSATQTTATILGDGTITANFQAQPTDKLVFTEGTNQYIELNRASTKITVQRQTSSGTPITTGTTTLNLASTSSGGKFYKDSACTQQITETSPLTITSDKVSFYYKDSSTGTPTITVSATHFASVQTTFNINTRSTGFDGDNWLYGFTVGSQPPWYVATGEGVDGTNCAKSDPYGINSGAFTANSLDTSHANTITISFMYKTENTNEADDFQIFYSVKTNPNLNQDSPDFTPIAFSISANSGWQTYTHTFTKAANPDMFDPTFWFRFQTDLEFGLGGAVESVWVDNVVISVA